MKSGSLNLLEACFFYDDDDDDDDDDYDVGGGGDEHHPVNQPTRLHNNMQNHTYTRHFLHLSNFEDTAKL
jgi:hypothetical protein